MEGIHGVDVSWLHHSSKDRNAHKTAAPTSDATQNGTTTEKGAPGSSHKHHLPHLPKTNATSTNQSPQSPRRSSLLHRSTSEKQDTSDLPATTSKSQKDPRPSGASRKSSWVSSLSSKFSGSNAASTRAQDGAASPKAPKSPQIEQANPYGAPITPGAQEEKKGQESTASTPPGSPSPAKHGFLQNAMRRLSASGGTSMGKAPVCGGICARRTMNVDPYRERCALPELEQKKLRRVAFCVDVEIAGSAQYGQEPQAEQPEEKHLSVEDVSPQTQLERQIMARQEQRQRLRTKAQGKPKGTALKFPAPAEPDNGNSVHGDPVDVPPTDDASSALAKAADKSTEESKEMSKKKEKKKRSEGERKERKERRQKDALANGMIPAELHEEESTSSTGSSKEPHSPARAQDRPTTDPLRIYRRCCQLRETPILKRVVEQISSPAACAATTPGIVSCLDLSGYLMQLPDIITLGDYLAVVPVKKLNMEGCGLGDEAVRVLLAGLLAAKTPDQAKFNKRLNKKSPVGADGAMEKLGVVEKVNLKHNPKIGREGWQHIALFIHLSRSLKAIDLSMIPFPQQSRPPGNVASPTLSDRPAPVDVSAIFHEAISTRLAGDHLEELVMSSCKLSMDNVGHIVDAVMECGATRLGLASNDLNQEGIQHILRYLKTGRCQGLDVGGNDLRNHVKHLADALDPESPLFALSLADCKLDPSCLEIILPALLRLTNFRFIDLSHNQELFATKPSCLNTLRKYLPQFPILRRLHLLDVAMTPEHAIALAEILPECKQLAHLNILENHLVSPLADAKTETAQEEACAFYASFMAAVRVSETLIAIDIDVPTADSSEIVKALAKQVVFYSLRNLERLPLVETTDSAIAAMTEPHAADQDQTVPDVLLQLVGHVDDYPGNHDKAAPAADNDYIVGGTGVVKALDICLKRSIDGRKSSMTGSPMESGTSTPQGVLQGNEVTKGKAKDMSKNLLGSARKIRARLQPALIQEARTGDDMAYRRLKFLDSTLEGMIQRFEDEYPETRITGPVPPLTDEDQPESLESSTALKPAPSQSQTNLVDLMNPNVAYPQQSVLSRQSSSRSLATKQAQEEGRMHRFGQRLRREILKPEQEDHEHGTRGTEQQTSHMQALRRRLEECEGPQIQRGIEQQGVEGVLAIIGASAKELEELERQGRDCSEMKDFRERALAIYRDEMGRPEGGGQRKGNSEGEEVIDYHEWVKKQSDAGA